MPTIDGIGVVALTPQPIADDGDQIARVERPVLRKSGPELRSTRRAAGTELRARLDRAHADRLEPRLGEVHLRPPPRRRVRERGLRVAIVHEVDGRQLLFRQRLLGVALPDRDELLRLAERQRPQQHGVDDAEDCGRGAGAEAERQDRDRRERRRAAPLAPREPEVAADARDAARRRRPR